MIPSAEVRCGMGKPMSSYVTWASGHWFDCCNSYGAYNKYKWYNCQQMKMI
uniref:Uncharacterized protein n=1 Tax=Arundo donax TaxID=35708 RepID=A0A0A9EIZ7_ARUDO